MVKSKKVVTKKVYDDKKADVADKKAKMEEKCFRKGKDGSLVRRRNFKENTTKWGDSWSYILSNVGEIWSECFDVEIKDGEEVSKMDNDARNDLIMEIYDLSDTPSFKMVSIFFGHMAEAGYIKAKKELEEMTVEEENSSTESSTIEDYNDTSDCSEDDINDLKSNKGK